MPRGLIFPAIGDYVQPETPMAQAASTVPYLLYTVKLELSDLTPTNEQIIAGSPTRALSITPTGAVKFTMNDFTATPQSYTTTAVLEDHAPDIAAGEAFWLIALWIPGLYVDCYVSTDPTNNYRDVGSDGYWAEFESQSLGEVPIICDGDPGVFYVGTNDPTVRGCDDAKIISLFYADAIGDNAMYFEFSEDDLFRSDWDHLTNDPGATKSSRNPAGTSFPEWEVVGTPELTLSESREEIRIVLCADSINAWFVNTPAPNLYLPNDIYAGYGRTVVTRETLGGTNPYEDPQNGAEWYGGWDDTQIIHLYDGAFGGSQIDDWNSATVLQAKIGDVDPHVVIVSLGVNGTVDTNIDTLLADIPNYAPNAEIIVIAQNPVNESTDPTRRNTLQAAAATAGATFIDVWQEFIDYGDFHNDLLADGVHPNAAGSQMYVDTVLPVLAEVAGFTRKVADPNVMRHAAMILRGATHTGGSGDDWLDESGNGNDAVPTNAPVFSSGVWTTDSGDQSQLIVASDPSLDVDPQRGWTMVLVGEDTTGNGFAMSRRNNGQPWIDMSMGGANDRAAAGVNDGVTTGSKQGYRSSPYVVPGKIVTVALRLAAGDSSNVSDPDTNGLMIRIGAIVDGVHYWDPHEHALDIRDILPTSPVRIGGWQYGYYSGDAHGAAIFPRSLSDDEVALVGEILKTSDHLTGASGHMQQMGA